MNRFPSPPHTVMISNRVPPSWLQTARRLLINTGRRRFPEMEPRRWSNVVLKEICASMEGEVVNVSGWRDEDRYNNVYRNYFPLASSYDITNYWGTGAENDGAEGSIFLDLTGDLPPELEGRYDVAFCHTVFEHIFDVPKAMKNLAALSRDLVILIVPTMQDEHYLEPIYGDYWRFMPGGLRQLMQDNGLQTVYFNANDNPWYPIYSICVGSRNPTAWENRFPLTPERPYLGRDVYNGPGFVWHT